MSQVLLKTQNYMDGKYTLPDAVAASGGAVSPSESNNPLAGVLLTLTNFRLGQWVENPAFKPRLPRLWKSMRKWPFVPARWMVSLLRPAEDRPYCLVTDGGYYENLGVEALLRRRCKFIIAVDAGQDEKHQFTDFIRLVRRARLEYGITLEPLDKKLARQMLDCISLTPNHHPKSPVSKGTDPKKSGEQSVPAAWTKRHFTPVRVEYPDGTTGLMVYMKSSLTGDEPLELIYYQKQHPKFPHDDTGDQFFDADQFLSYLQLGSHMSETLAKPLENLPLDSLSVEELERLFTRRKKVPRDETEVATNSEPDGHPSADGGTMEATPDFADEDEGLVHSATGHPKKFKKSPK